jgi:pSer/pThr/pTyr-binding forkhead associated (FHA) protein
VLLYAFSDTICDNVQHYLDGLFFTTICNLLAVMMVYKVCYTRPTPTLPQWHALTIRSSGTTSQRRTSSSRSVLSLIPGRLRNPFQRKIVVQRPTRTPTRSMPEACITIGRRLITVTITDSIHPQGDDYFFPFCHRT